jgi:hypothetical protein
LQDPSARATATVITIAVTWMYVLITIPAGCDFFQGEGLLSINALSKLAC